MISLRALAAATIALSGTAYPIAISGSHPEASEGTVLSLLVRPDSARVDVVVGVRGDVNIKDFTLHSPERIVVDVNNATLGMARGQSYDRAARGGIINVNYAQNRPNVVRVVLTLDAPHQYRVTREAEGVRISVQGTTTNLPAWAVGYQAATLASRAPASAIRPEARTTLPSSTSSAPAKSASPKTSSEEKSAMWVNGIKLPLPQQQSQQRRITINFEDMPILDVLKIFSEYSGRTILASKEVKGNISASIADIPWDIALRALLNLNGFDASENPDYGMITVDTYDNVNKQAASLPMTTVGIPFNYTSAQVVADMLKGRLSRDCGSTITSTPGSPPVANAAGIDPATGVSAPTVQSAQPVSIITTGNCPIRGAVTFDTLTNTVYVTDVPDNAARLREYALTLDKRQSQVNIRAKIILVDRTQLEGLGLRYDLGSQDQFFNDLIPRNDSAGNALSNSGQISLGGNTIAAIANAGARVPGAALQLAYSTALGAFDFTTFFEALQSTSLLDVQAEPNGTVLNNRTLLLQAGSDVPIRTAEPGAGANSAGSVAQVTVQTRTTGIILQVTPRVTNDGRIQMKVHIENSSVTFSGSDAIAFPTQKVDNEIMIADGSTWVIGGLTQTSVTSTRTGIPLLMELPVIGKLFGVTNRQETKRDLLILITPHVVDPGQDAGRP